MDVKEKSTELMVTCMVHVLRRETELPLDGISPGDMVTLSWEEDGGIGICNGYVTSLTKTEIHVSLDR